MFGFDGRFVMFDVTPVENQFIQEYLPGAKGDHVKVYLYGLMRCYHPEENMSPAQMARELDMSEEDILSAYRYWERRGIVRRISDDPVEYRYINLKQKSLTSDPVIDPKFEAFTRDLYGVFDQDRRLHGGEISSCYEWVEEMKLEPEAVIMLLKHMAKVKGKNFRIRDAEKLAVRMASEGILSAEDAETFLSQDREVCEGTRAVLKRLGKKNLPSEDQLTLYRKWTRDWGFSRDAVLTACADTVAMPSMETLDTVLRKIKTATNGNEKIGEELVVSRQQTSERLKAMMDIWGWTGMSQERIDWYTDLEKQYDPDIILLAARECARQGGNRQTNLTELLSSWKKRGLNTREAVSDYICAFKEKTALLTSVHKLWGTRISREDSEYERALLSRWQEEFGFDKEVIMKAAEYAAEADKPMAYLDKILEGYSKKGIRTVDDVQKEHASGKDRSGHTGKIHSAQQYEQRDYTGVQDSVDELVKHLRREE